LGGVSAPETELHGPVVLVLDHFNVYQTSLLEGVRSVLGAAGIPLVVYANDSFAIELRPVAKCLLRSAGVRGVITTLLTDPASQADLAATVASTALPSVGIGAVAANGWSVGVDNAAGMRALMGHLLDDAGAKRIAILLGVEHHADARERVSFVHAELAARGLAAEFVLEGGFERDVAYASIKRLLKTGAVPDAIVAMNDRSAVGAMDALDDEGLRVPEDVMVVGFDDDVIAQECTPTLTTVNQNLVAQGERAAQLLLSQLDGGSSVGHATQASTLVVRGSTRGADPAENPAAATPISWSIQATASASIDNVLGVHRAFMACKSVHELLDKVAANTTALGLRRCFIVLNESADADPNARGVLVLNHTDRGTYVTPDVEPFRLADLLPTDVRDEMSHGSLTLRPLSVETRNLGYVLFEEVDPGEFVGELLRTDLSRAIDSLHNSDRQVF
jgi:DNA-binding LacI/PurR family transcriptional regulator